MEKTKSVVLVGTGPMAVEYAKVLKDQKIFVVVVGRGEESAKKFTEETGLEVSTGGIDNWLAGNSLFPRKAIIAVSEDQLGVVTLKLLNSGFKDILVEKPGGKNSEDMIRVARAAKKHSAKVCLGYNRRFYASVIEGQKIITKDGGVTSFNFEFTEWSHVIADLKKAPGIKNEWFLHNSTHIIDLAFFLGGEPRKISSYTSGGLNWHKRASVFAGSGQTKKGALFSYQANWEAPGRWGVEILTKKHRLILKPLEKLQIQNIGSVAVGEVKIGDKLDLKYKPGLYNQIKFFLSGQTKDFCSIEEQVKNLKIYKVIGDIK